MAVDLQAEKNALDLKVAKSDLAILQNLKTLAADGKLEVTAAKMSTAAAGLIGSDMAKTNVNNLSSAFGMTSTILDGAIGEQERKIEMLAAAASTPEASA